MTNPNKPNGGMAAVYGQGDTVPEMRPIKELLAEAAALGVTPLAEKRGTHFAKDGTDISDLVPVPEEPSVIWARWNKRKAFGLDAENASA